MPFDFAQESLRLGSQETAFSWLENHILASQKKTIEQRKTGLFPGKALQGYEFQWVAAPIGG